MELYDLFYKWVPAPVKLLLLTLILFVTLVANGVFLGNITDMYSSLGVYVESYTMATNALYIGMGLGLITGMRLKMRFTGKALLLFGLVNMLAMNIVCATTNNPHVIVAAVLWLGFSKMTALTEVFIIWMVIWSKKLDTSRVYPFIYSMALAGLYFTTWLTTRLAYIYHWRYAYLLILALILLCIFLALLFVENHALKRKVPLYQMDWPGLIAIALVLMLINYVFVYGKVEDWFNSPRIVAACFGIIITSLFFVRREIHLRRPVIDLRIFKGYYLIAGLSYFMLLGFFAPSTFQSAFAGGILQYEAFRNTELNLYMIPGVIAGAALCYYWYYHSHNRHVLIFLGFFSFIVYHYILYKSFGWQFSLEDFWLPSVFKGFAMVVLYISVGLYCTYKIEFKNIMTVAGIVIIVRSFVATGIFSGIYNYYVYAQRVRHFALIAGNAERTDVLFTGNAVAASYAQLQAQATLAALKELTGAIIIIGLVILFIVGIGLFCKKLPGYLYPAPAPRINPATN